ncbi:hypothetical protein TomMM35A_33810 [Sphingobium sp. TomMM35A]
MVLDFYNPQRPMLTQNISQRFKLLAGFLPHTKIDTIFMLLAPQREAYDFLISETG